jgi:YesN/AraC family two-component response regulator
MLPKIVFVDDEICILNGIKRSLFLYKKEWSTVFFDSGVKALEYMKSASVDVLVSDVRMPNMDGIELFNIVSSKYPNIIRIILSGYTYPSHVKRRCWFRRFADR